METNIPAEALQDPAVQHMASAIKACVHCGFCLSTCPTYLETASELDSPRGRIYLMKGVLENSFPLDTTVTHHIDRCLGCLACVTACPSGVKYNELIDNFRPKLEAEYARTLLDRVTRLTLMQVLPYPARFRLATTVGKLGRPFAGMLPKPMRTMLSLLPQTALPAAQTLPEITPAVGQRRARVALLSGCVQSVLEPAINLATLRVLARNGVEVIVPRGQGCCGALAQHIGQKGAAKDFARRNLAAFPTDVDAVLTNAAGCGSTFKDYAHLMEGEPEAEAAQHFTNRAQDVSQFLAALGLVTPPAALPRKVRVAYHDACHLAHAQSVRAQPRQLLQQIPNLEIAEISEADVCCGSAGVYNITQPELAASLLQRKVANILATRAEMVATGNIGCLTQLRTGLIAAGNPVTIAHTMQLLDWAYNGNFPLTDKDQ